jgi:hypothetical protein
MLTGSPFVERKEPPTGVRSMNNESPPKDYPDKPTDVAWYGDGGDRIWETDLKPSTYFPTVWRLIFRLMGTESSYNPAVFELTESTINDLYRRFEIASDVNLHVIELLDTPTRRKIIEYVQNELDEDSQIRVQEVMEYTDLTRTSINNELDTPGSILEYNILALDSEPDVNSKHYCRGESQVLDLLEAWDGYSIIELFESEARRDIIQFFLTEANPQQWYSTYTLAENEESVGTYETIGDHLDKLVRSGLLTARDFSGDEEGERERTEYRCPTGTPLRSQLLEINQAARHEYGKLDTENQCAAGES